MLVLIWHFPTNPNYREHKQYTIALQNQQELTPLN